jgi:hypothetical protein
MNNLKKYLDDLIQKSRLINLILVVEEVIIHSMKTAILNRKQHTNVQ